MKLKLDQKFGMLQDTVQVDDPWGTGMVLTVLRRGSKKFRRWLQAAARRSPLQRLMSRAMGKAFVGAIAGGRDNFTVEQLEKILQRELEGASIPDSEVAEIFDGDGVEEAIALLEGWAGDGAPMDEKGTLAPATEENKRDLLTDPMVIPDGQPFAGRTLGNALVEIIQAAADGADILRNACLEEAGKASGPGSDGSSGPGPSNPPAADTSESVSGT